MNFEVNSEPGIVCCLYGRTTGQCRAAVLLLAEFAIHVTGLIHRKNKGSSRAQSTLFFVSRAPAGVQTLLKQLHLVVKNITDAKPRFDSVSWLKCPCAAATSKDRETKSWSILKNPHFELYNKICTKSSQTQLCKKVTIHEHKCMCQI